MCDYSNKKEEELFRILDNVVLCCVTRYVDGTASLTRDDVLGRSRSEVVVMTRAILVQMIISAGYSTSTAARLLNRDIHSIRHLVRLSQRLRKCSRAYRIAEEEAEKMCRKEG